MPTSVALSPQMEAFVRSQVDSGDYNNVSEVVRAGLRLLARKQQEDAAKLEGLRHAVAIGLNELDSGQGTALALGEVDAKLAALGRGALKRAAQRQSRSSE